MRNRPSKLQLNCTAQIQPSTTDNDLSDPSGEVAVVEFCSGAGETQLTFASNRT